MDHAHQDNAHHQIVRDNNAMQFDGERRQQAQKLEEDEEEELHIGGAPELTAWQSGGHKLVASGGLVRELFGKKRTLSNGDAAELANEEDSNDPFAFTFEDYLREASRGHLNDEEILGAGFPDGAHHSKSTLADDQLSNDLPTGDRFVLDSHHSKHRTGPTIEIVNEEEDEPPQKQQQEKEERSRTTANLAVSNSSSLDYIFPAAELATPTTTKPPTPTPTTTTTTTTTTANGATSDTTSKEEEIDGDKQVSGKAVSEIGLLFAWRSLPTNKCSKDCGRGFRLNHLSCIDSKFNVRVEDQLCERAQLQRPSQVNEEEPCNQHDCPPQWSSIEIKQCGGETEQLSANGSGCKPSVFKRIECVRVDASGETVHLDESLCAQSESSPETGSERSSKQQATSEGAAVAIVDEQTPTPIGSSSFDLNEFSLVDLGQDRELAKEQNEIHRSRWLAEEDVGDKWQQATSEGKTKWRHNHPEHAQQSSVYNSEQSATSGEPFYQASEWSECSGARCGQLGTRRRNVTCRMYLARSAKLVHLPRSSCQALGQQGPHTEEPCYIDCGAPIVGDSSNLEAPSGGSLQETAEESRREKNSAPVAMESGEREAAKEAAANGFEFTEMAASELGDENELVYETQRFVWRHSGWTKCSAECLGGKSESLLECWDKIAQLVVEPERCPQSSKPKTQVKICNEIACPAEWRLEPFGNCSRPCGSAGIRTRSVACVQMVPLQTGHSSYMLVSNELCIQAAADQNKADIPHTIEPCNRVDCPPEWSVGPWTECQPLGGGTNNDSCTTTRSVGLRNRTVICVQEFADRDGPSPTGMDVLMSANKRELLEAISHSAKHWHPGKATQVPAQHCARLYNSYPAFTEHCHPPVSSAESCGSSTGTPELLLIDSDPTQDYRFRVDSTSGRRRTVTLKVGGQAVLPEGRNVKIRCRVIAMAPPRGGPMEQLVAAAHQKRLTNVRVDWFKDGVQIFGPNGTHRSVEKVFMASASNLDNLDDDDLEESNSISKSDLLNHHEYQASSSSLLADSLMAADEPQERRKTRRGASSGSSRKRKLRTRSSLLSGVPFHFVPQIKGRFSLVKENTLRIKRLRPDDSGVYTCSINAWQQFRRHQQLNGASSESIELNVVAKREQIIATTGTATNLGGDSDNY